MHPRSNPSARPVPQPPSRTADRRAEFGRRGEELACALLTRSGLRILARNWRCREGEIDIVAHAGDLLVICEVKTRSGDRLGTPAAAVTLAKQRRLRQLAMSFIAEHAARPCAVRFDVVAVTWARGREPVVEHLVGVF
jgi:putative endonuclease